LARFSVLRLDMDNIIRKRRVVKKLAKRITSYDYLFAVYITSCERGVTPEALENAGLKVELKYG